MSKVFDESENISFNVMDQKVIIHPHHFLNPIVSTFRMRKFLLTQVALWGTQQFALQIEPITNFKKIHIFEALPAQAIMIEQNLKELIIDHKKLNAILLDYHLLTEQIIFRIILVHRELMTKGLKKSS